MPEVSNVENLTEIERLELDSGETRTIVVRFPIIHASLAFVGMPWNPLFPENPIKEAEFQLHFRNMLYAASQIPKQMVLLVVYYVNKKQSDATTYEMSLIDVETAKKMPLKFVMSLVSGPLNPLPGETGH